MNEWLHDMTPIEMLLDVSFSQKNKVVKKDSTKTLF
jgi:hypothetical protein